MSYETLYHEDLVDHYRHPRNCGVLEHADFSSGVCNPLCGDQVSIAGIIKDNTITQCMFQAKGCVISVAAASMLTEQSIGRSLKEVLALDKNAMLALVKVKLGPTRLRCALLALEALQNALKEYQKKGT